MKLSCLFGSCLSVKHDSELQCGTAIIPAHEVCVVHNDGVSPRIYFHRSLSVEISKFINLSFRQFRVENEQLSRCRINGVDQAFARNGYCHVV